MESLNINIQKRQNVLADYMRRLEFERNTAVGSTQDYSAVVDKENNHFMLLRTGWSKDTFHYKVLLHLDIHPKSGSIWVQQNNTEILPDQDLFEYGIHRSDFVLGFRPEWMRGQAGLAAV